MGLEGVTKKSQAAVKTSAMRTSAFPFLQLPAEIRNQIYELVFTQDIHFHHRSDKGKEPPSRNNMLSVLLLNRQMYAETRLLPFNFSTFVFNKALTASVVPSIYFTRDCMDLLDGLPDWQRSEIRHLEFPVAKGELKDFLHTDIHSACREKAWRALGYALDDLEARFALLDQYRKAWEQDISVVDLEYLGHWTISKRFFRWDYSLRSVTMAGTKIRLDIEGLLPRIEKVFRNVNIGLQRQMYSVDYSTADNLSYGEDLSKSSE